MKLSEALDQYVYICLQAMGSLKKYNPRYKSLKPLGNRLKNLIAQILLLHIVMPHKINFTQMERFGTHTEKTFREAHREKIDWLKFNLALMERIYSSDKRLAIAIDPSYIPKSGKHTPWVGMFGLAVPKPQNADLKSWAWQPSTSTSTTASLYMPSKVRMPKPCPVPK